MDPAQEEIHCKDIRNELKGCHNKIVWLNFVLMQDSWQQLKSDSTSWQKNTEEFSQFTESVACREYNLPRNENSSEPKGWIRGNTKIGPVLEVTTSYLQGKYGEEMRIEALNKDHFHSWVRISHGLNKLVTNLNNNEQETSEMQFEDFALKTNVLAFASRSKAKAKPQRRTLASPSTRTLPIGERRWTGIEPEDYSPVDYPVSKQLITLLRHGDLPRDEDGAIEFWRLKDYLRNDLVRSQRWSDEMWKSTMAQGRGNKKRFQYCPDRSGQRILSPSSSRSFRTQSHRSFIARQCINSERFLRVHLSHRMCYQFALHHEFRIDTWRTKFQKRQTVFFTAVNPMKKEHKDPYEIDLKAPRHARYLRTAWKKHQNTVYWVDIRLVQKKGLKFYQTRSNAIILYDTLPAYCIPKAIKMETGEIIYEKVFASPWPLRSFLLKTIGWKNWVQKLLEVEKTPNKPTQKPKI